jgi:rsbT co-antagonist protein RsbR
MTKEDGLQERVAESEAAQAKTELLDQISHDLDAAGDKEELLQALNEARRMRMVVEQSIDGIAIADLGGSIEFANTVWAQMHGYSVEELLGKPLSIFHTEEQLQEEVIPINERAMEVGACQGEIGHVRRDGTTFPTWMSITVLKDREGNPVGLVGVARDITEQKEIEAERERLQQEVIEAQRHVLQELSTPIIPVMERIIVMPLVGSIDTMRARDITRSLLAGIREHRAKVVILDITGVAMVDSGVADHLNKTIQAARLKGARTIVTGISDAVAETIVDLGIDWGGVETLSDLQTGLVVALNSLGIKLSMSSQ